jgi:ADP-heptose:LPS heptosyltransferase
MHKPVEKILFITLSNIGDVVLTTTLLDRIIYDHPHAKVDIVVGKTAAPLLQHLPCVNELYVVEKRKFHWHHIEMYKHFSGRAYDLIVDLRTPLLGKLLKSKQKIGFQHKNDGTHMSHQFCRIWPTEQNRAYQPWVEIPEHIQAEARQQTCQFEHLIAIAPTANWRGKQWPQKRYAELIQRLAASKACANTTFMVTGAPWEAPLIEDLLKSLPKGRALNMMGRLDLLQTAAWFQNIDLFIGNDSGLVHLAGAMGAPTLTIFGPMYYDRYQAISPYSEILVPPERPWREVNLAKDAYPRLITDISVDMVLAKAQEMLQNLAAKKEAIA